MKKQIINTFSSLTIVSTMSSFAGAAELSRSLFDNFSGHCKDNIAPCIISAPTTLPMATLIVITVGPLALTMDGKANEAVAAAQEPAFMVLNNLQDANENPLFQNAVTELKKENPQLREVSDQELASIILKIGEQLSY